MIVSDTFDTSGSVVIFIQLALSCGSSFSWTASKCHQKQGISQKLCEKGVNENFAIFTGKHLCWSLFLIKLQTSKTKHILKILRCSHCKIFNVCLATEACNVIKKKLHHSFFPVNIAKFLRTPVLKNIYERLLLKLPVLRESLINWQM